MASKQFVVQLYGCNLDCPYCYVTRSGVWGVPTEVPTSKLVQDFISSGQGVFHLMGGAPALYLDKWPELIAALPKDTVFHSDFLLTERSYDPTTLFKIAKPNTLFAVDIKGTSEKNYLRNTRRPMRTSLFWANLESLVIANVPFYITFTAPDPEELLVMKEELSERFGSQILDDSFTIDLIQYKALPFVDVHPK